MQGDLLMGFVREMIKRQLEFKEMAEDEERNAARVSLTMPYVDNRRAEYAAKYLGMSKSSFIADVVASALSEFEDEAGISKDEKYYGKFYHYLMSTKPIDELDAFMVKDVQPDGEILGKSIKEFVLPKITEDKTRE